MTAHHHRFLRSRRNRALHVTGSSEVERWPTDAQIKHLEFIQAVVSRMATNSYIAKGWSLTVTVAIYSFAANHLNPWIAAVGFIPILGFWWLDAWYLRQERLFRCLYDDVRQPDSPVTLFSMHVKLYRLNPFTHWPRVIFSTTLVIFYGILLVAGLAIVGTSIVHSYNRAPVVHSVKRAHAAKTSSAVSSNSLSEKSGLVGQMSPT